MNIQARRALSVFSLTMITVGSVDSIRNLPTTALFGSQLIAFFILGALFFLIPTALISAELASGWPEQGGIYVWVREAFGKKAGFLAIWLQWVENVIWYPVILMFVAGTMGYLIAPSLASDAHFLWAVIVGSFWGATLLNYRGMKASSMFSTLCTLCGLLLPMILIIALGLSWILGNHPIHIQLNLEHMMPHWHESGVWASLTGVMMSLCGVEIATVHANDVDSPQKAFPRALSYSVMIILATLIFGSLSIAMVLPHDEINLVAGIMQAFEAFFSKYHALWFMPWVALMLILGGLGGVNNWIIAPIKGLLVAAHDGHLSSYVQRTNAHGVPVVLLWIQAIIVTFLSTIVLYFPSVNGSYWFLTALAAQLYMMMYLMMFAAVIKLRWKHPNHPRAFKIPGGSWGLFLVAGMGTLGALGTIVVSFMHPDGINVGSIWTYDTLLLIGLLVMCWPAFWMAQSDQDPVLNCKDFETSVTSVSEELELS